MQTVRGGQRVWPYCSECGCRLDISHIITDGLVLIRHFSLSPKKDFRGCSCSAINFNFYLPKDKVKEYIGV